MKSIQNQFTMKKVLALAVLISSFSVSTFASDTTENRCRQLKSYSTLSHSKQVEDDLSSGIWTFENATTEFTLEFDANGIANQISESDAGYLTQSTMLWNVQTFGEATVLTLTEPSLTTQRFLIKQNCEGVLLKSTQGEGTAQWNFEKPRKPYALETLEMQLSGQWKTVSYTEDGRTQQYDFGKNGQFTLTENASDKTGVWEITDDGRFISIYLKDKNGHYHDRMVLKIADIDYHVASFFIDQDDTGMKIQYLEKV